MFVGKPRESAAAGLNTAPGPLHWAVPRAKPAYLRRVSGLDTPMEQGTVSTQYALRPLSAEEEETAQAMVRDMGTSLLVLPTHHIDSWGDFQGFRFVCPGQRTAVDLPISKQLFFGHTATECEEHEDAIIRLMSTPVENQVR